MATVDSGLFSGTMKTSRSKVEVADEMILSDLDTPADYEAFRCPIPLTRRSNADRVQGAVTGQDPLQGGLV